MAPTFSYLIIALHSYRTSYGNRPSNFKIINARKERISRASEEH
jgi:hypothetical protein